MNTRGNRGNDSSSSADYHKPGRTDRWTGFSTDFITESFGISPDGKSLVISAMVERRSLKLAEGVSLGAWE